MGVGRFEAGKGWISDEEDNTPRIKRLIEYLEKLEARDREKVRENPPEPPFVYNQAKGPRLRIVPIYGCLRKRGGNCQ